MADAKFEHPDLAAIYDAVEADRSDLDAYLRMAEEFGARRILDIGCGTGVFALQLAGRGLEVTGLDPAGASLDVARAKPGADRVHWIHGDITALPPLPPLGGFDLITMTANVAQAIDSPALWSATLRGAHAALRPGGRLVFETREPARRAWESWNREESYEVVDVPGAGEVESWYDVLDAGLPLVTFRQTCVFRATGTVLTSDSTLRFRTREDIATDLAEAGFPTHEIRDAPDRPGRELVFVTRRPPHGPAGN
ncbi:class I SAM-dependent methyltransferase [Streptomyces qinzhouensis]|uniref:Class I SAM-dependent methyltransferase n=1 Tax=Streptomyces qinzhouensis TaxID=2599401 RepID=A0A5B8JDG5_9ACTN|nr:class I SAM-dependent methyltransferase [Streptomyces qinzhouensis]QDY78001.1 class I SAM-dependent methyltransferase [Streptomyces qinzhouensis]